MPYVLDDRRGLFINNISQLVYIVSVVQLFYIFYSNVLLLLFIVTITLFVVCGCQWTFHFPCQTSFYFVSHFLHCRVVNFNFIYVLLLLLIVTITLFVVCGCQCTFHIPCQTSFYFVRFLILWICMDINTSNVGLAFSNVWIL